MLLPSVEAPAVEAVEIAKTWPDVEPGEVVTYWKNSITEPQAAFVTRVNRNGAVSLSVVGHNRAAFIVNPDLNSVPHLSCRNATNSQLNPRGYWDVSADKRRIRELEERVKKQDALLEQVMAAVTKSTSGK